MRPLITAACAIMVAPAMGQMPPGPQKPFDENALRAEFQHKFAAWRAEQVRRGFAAYSDLRARTECQSYENIAAMGVRGVPFLVEETEEFLVRRDLNRLLLRYALEQVIKRRFESPEAIVAWWKARPQAPVEFEKHYTRWKQARANGVSSLETTEKVYDEARKVFVTKVTKTELGKAYDAMREFGIEAIPFVIEKLKAKDYDLLPLISELTLDEGHTQTGSLERRAQFTLDWWEIEKDKWLLPPVSAASCGTPSLESRNLCLAGGSRAIFAGHSSGKPSSRRDSRRASS